GFLIGWREFFQVGFDQVLTLTHLLAHDFANLMTLFATQVQLAVRTFAVHVLAVARAVHWTHRARAFWHGHGNGRQGSREHQSDKGLAHRVSPVSIPVSPDECRLRRSRS